MTLQDFIGLTMTRKAETVFNSQFIASREEDEYRILLYKLESFYAEVYYNRKIDRIEKIKPFTNNKKLQEYFVPMLN